jgi:hypothetical protein
MFDKIIVITGGKVTHAVRDSDRKDEQLVPNRTVCGMGYTWHTTPKCTKTGKPYTKVTCKKCRNILCTLKETTVSEQNFPYEILDHIIMTLKLAHGMATTCSAGVTMTKELYLKKIWRNSWSHRDKELWEFVKKELERLLSPYDTWKKQLFKYTPGLAGLIAALAEVPAGKKKISEAEVIMLESLALTKGIKLDCHLRSILIEDGADLIEWLRTVVVVKE